MKVEHQGEGSYTYDCRKSDCWFCDAMGLTPLPEIIEEYEPDPMPVIDIEVAKLYSLGRKFNNWSAKEIDKLKRYQFESSEFIASKLPLRTKMAVYIKMHNLRKKGVLSELSIKQYH